MECKFDGCQNAVKAKGFCQKHYVQLWRTGSPERTRGTDKAKHRKHWMYGAYAQMVNRCTNPNNASYSRYGGLGITVCDRWRYGDGARIGFGCFLEDMGERPFGKTLDRIDPTGPYSPENCRWADAKLQRSNISQRGLENLRRTGSEARTEFWKRWRSENEIRPDIGPFAQRRLCELQRGPVKRPSDRRMCRSFDSLVKYGLADLIGGEYLITIKGLNWLSGGRPQKRRLAASLEV